MNDDRISSFTISFLYPISDPSFDSFFMALL